MRSMTGYGAAVRERGSVRVAVEVRSLNQRFLEVRLTGPREYGPLEGELRGIVRSRVARGRVEVNVSRTGDLGARGGRQRRRVTGGLRVCVDEALARAYVSALRRLGRKLGLAGELGIDVLRSLPGVVEVSEVPVDLRRERPVVLAALRAALGAFDRERRREGDNLRRDMAARVRRLKRLAAEMGRRVPRAEAALGHRHRERLGRLLDRGEVDPARLAQEAAMLVARSDVSEELVRLASHLSALGAALARRGAVGKQIEFILQELVREANTIGAKAGDLGLGELVLEAKGEIEKLREQVQNVE